MLLALTLVSVACRPQSATVLGGLTVSVTYSGPAAQLKNLIPKLAAEFHLSLSVDPTLEPDVMMVSFRDVPVGDALDELAKAGHAAWKREGD